MVGEVVEVDVGKSRECSFLRVRVRVNVTKPFQRCVRVDVMGEGEEIVMILRYELLLNHCFWCGRIGHTMQECQEASKGMAVEREVEPPLGTWLRATGLEKLGGQKGRRSNSFYKSPAVCNAHEKTVDRKSGEALLGGSMVFQLQR
ncbi:hypothetical protein Ddye_008310 [Dipteronia dyeriana]|uniref:CCHC-type domain-containing protein n=1 Tax=Dipteronia dyeriana TaxID=168575 RepID=A0AAE0CLS7_9ROSI|nr:hypothetical protein Ddye_008310 [Dipteronia dyeriana]